MAAAAAMPGTVAAAGATLAALEAGDLKLRVRVLESERADRRQGVLQVRWRRAWGPACDGHTGCRRGSASVSVGPPLWRAAVLQRRAQGDGRTGYGLHFRNHSNFYLCALVENMLCTGAFGASNRNLSTLKASDDIFAF